MLIDNQAQPVVDEVQIAERAMDVIRRNAGRSIRMAALGQEVSKGLNVSLRGILGKKPLSQLLRTTYPSELLITGEGTDVEVALAPEGAGQSPARKYDPAVFSAFSKPIAEGFKRWLKVSRPFKFSDLPSDQTGHGLEVEVTVSPDQFPSRLERNAAVEAAIGAWSERVGIDLSALPSNKKPSASLTSQGPVGDRGVLALRALAEAIPTSERGRYSLPLDLIGRLLGV